MASTGNTQRSSLWIFYLIFTYILISFLWWTSLFLKGNSQDFHRDVKAYKERFLSEGGDPQNFESTKVYVSLQKELKRRNAMIAGEGIVFISLISIGFWKIRKSFREEIELTRQQNNFILSITHELKSPLASIKLALETQLRHQPLDEVRRQRLSTISLEEVQRLESLVENILLASRLESRADMFDHQIMDLEEIVREVAGKFKLRQGLQNPLNIRISGSCMVKADKSAMRSVLINLLENAGKYSGNDSVIKLRLYRNDSWVVLQVADQGNGIPTKEIPNIFKRFYRIGNEETRSSKGTGLGLYIVDSIIRNHGGTISVLPNEPRGTVFEVKLPSVSV